MKKVVAALIEGGHLALGRVEHGGDSLPVALPPGPQVSLEVLDGVALGVGDEQVAGDGLLGDGVEEKLGGEVGVAAADDGRGVHGVGLGQHAGGDEGAVG